MSQTQPPPPKKEVVLALLERSSVHVHLDPRLASVVVPVGFKTLPQLVLQVGLNMKVPIPDLRVDDDGMSCTLSFNRMPFFCVVPWVSVFAMVGDDGRAVVWPDDIPAEVARQAQQVRVVDGGAPKDPPRPMSARDQKSGVSPATPNRGRDLVDLPKPKRPRKRPVLAAVAVADAPGQDGPPNAVRPVRSTADGAPRDAVSPTAQRPAYVPTPRSSANGSRKKKKDLPPYLRVVK